jgi:outer membrane protein OmpA-like peptidoglycan-associated protein
VTQRGPRRIFAVLLVLLGVAAEAADDGFRTPLTPQLALSLSATTVRLSGDVASSTHADALERLARQRFPAHEVEAALEPAQIGHGDWQVLTLSAVYVLAETAAGRIDLSPRAADINGLIAADGSLFATRLSRLESVAGPDFESRVTTHVVDASMSRPDACERMFRSIDTTDIRFMFGTAELRRSAHASLDRFVELAADCPGARFLVTGHTDTSGDPALNEMLSTARAAAVRDYLVWAGVAPQRLVAAGRGASAPIADNTTAWGRSRNRRIEIDLTP